MELCARLHDGFILFTPTNRFADARVRETLRTVRASLFALEDHLSLLPSGRLHATRSAGELFSPLLPKLNDAADEDSARRAFALVTAFEGDSSFKTAPVLAVFRLYCAEGLSAADVARRLGCSKATVINRLAVIRQKTGVDPDRLRAYSPHLEAMASLLRHPATQKIGYADD
jgi:DNA-directed RNA polymerase specialized sigma24 family protein